MLSDVVLGVVDRVIAGVASATERDPWRRRERLSGEIGAAEIQAEGGSVRARKHLAKLRARLASVDRELEIIERRAAGGAT